MILPSRCWGNSRPVVRFEAGSGDLWIKAFVYGQSPLLVEQRALGWEPGGDLLSRARCSLSLALICFTVLFGKGRGGSRRLLPPSVTCLHARLHAQNGKKGCDCLLMLQQGYRIKPHGQLVLVSLTHYCASTPSLSTSWSSTTL